mmetsp:Transcript_6878/g.31015  ORF Transcript_6878/g.31015 Transcript_6878/m.31015 type:complete len:287 (+) Transcript_6878:385-1245(+)
MQGERRTPLVASTRVTANEDTHCTFTSSTSKMSVALPGMAPFTPFLPYAMAGGMVSRRLSPTRMFATPTSQPLMTSPMPSLNPKVAEPLVWSKILPLWSLPTYFIVTRLPGSAFLPSGAPIATLTISMPFLNSRLSCLPVLVAAGVSGLAAGSFFSFLAGVWALVSFFSFLAGGASFVAAGSSGAARFFFSAFAGFSSSSSISWMVTPPFLVFFGASSGSDSDSSLPDSKSSSSSSASKSSRTPKSSASSSESYSSSSSSESSSSSSPIWRSYASSISSSSMSGMK